MFAHNIVHCGGKEVDMTESLDKWRKSLQERGMRVSRPKTLWISLLTRANKGNGESVNILGEELKRVTNFKCIRASIAEECGMKTEITKRVASGWRNGKKCSATQRCQRNWKGRSTKQWPGQQCYMGWKRGLQRRNKKNGSRWTRWECYSGCVEGHANNIRSETKTSEENGSGTGFQQYYGRRLNWYGRMMSRDEDNVLRNVLRTDIQGKGKRGLPKTRWNTRANVTSADSGRIDGWWPICGKPGEKKKKSLVMSYSSTGNAKAGDVELVDRPRCLWHQQIWLFCGICMWKLGSIIIITKALLLWESKA